MIRSLSKSPFSGRGLCDAPDQTVYPSVDIDLFDELLYGLLVCDIHAAVPQGERKRLARSRSAGIRPAGSQLLRIGGDGLASVIDPICGGPRRCPTKSIPAIGTSGKMANISARQTFRAAQSEQNTSTIAGLNRNGVPSTKSSENQTILQNRRVGEPTRVSSSHSAYPLVSSLDRHRMRRRHRT